MLYSYQSKYLEGLPRSVIMAADTGLGKTIMALEHAHRYEPIGNLVVVAPASKVKTGDWQREIDRYRGMAPPIEVFVVSYEKFTKTWRDYVDENTTIIADECHFICNSQSKRGKAVQIAARLCHQFIGLSATPLPNGWVSMENYAIIFGLVKNKTEFVQTYQIIDRRRGFPLLIGYRSEDVMQRFWHQVSKPLARSGDLDLPSQLLYTPITQSKETAKEFAEVRKTRVYGEELLDSAPKLFMTLRQLTTPDRLAPLENVLNDTNENVVVFYNFNSEREAILRLLEKKFKDRKVFEQSGHASRLPKREAWDSLSGSVTLAQYQSASQAIELTYASITVFFSPTYSYSNFTQAQGRTKRNGQDKTVLFYLFNVEGTLDGAIYKCLQAKNDFSETLYYKEYV